MTAIQRLLSNTIIDKIIFFLGLFFTLTAPIFYMNLRAHVCDVEVRTPEWDRVEQDARERDEDKDRSDRWERDDVRASDFERMS